MVPTTKEELRKLVSDTTIEMYEEMTPQLIQLIEETKRDENLTEAGRPLCKVKQINTLSGYILCQLADAQIPGTADEAVKINGYLNGGFFYE